MAVWLPLVRPNFAFTVVYCHVDWCLCACADGDPRELHTDFSSCSGCCVGVVAFADGGWMACVVAYPARHRIANEWQPLRSGCVDRRAARFAAFVAARIDPRDSSARGHCPTDAQQRFGGDVARLCAHGPCQGIERAAGDCAPCSSQRTQPRHYGRFRMAGIDAGRGSFR